MNIMITELKDSNLRMKNCVRFDIIFASEFFDAYQTLTRLVSNKVELLRDAMKQNFEIKSNNKIESILQIYRFDIMSPRIKLSVKNGQIV